MKRLLFCHILDPINIGDYWCCPLRHFDYSKFQTEEIDIRAELSSFDGFDAVIIGGGGMLCEGQISKIGQVWSRCRRRGVKVIGWGFGHNVVGCMPQWWPRFLAMFDLIRIRDTKSSLPICPCVSCMHPGFDKWRNSEPEHEMVYYAHWHRLMKPGMYPMMTNARRWGEMDDVLRFLSSGRAVITNTFHGAYWGLLLGRRVVVPERWATRFAALPDCVGDALAYSTPIPRYLEWARSCNRKMYLDSLALLA